MLFLIVLTPEETNSAHICSGWKWGVWQCEGAARIIPQASWRPKKATLPRQMKGPFGAREGQKLFAATEWLSPGQPAAGYTELQATYFYLTPHSATVVELMMRTSVSTRGDNRVGLF